MSCGAVVRNSPLLQSEHRFCEVCVCVCVCDEMSVSLCLWALMRWGVINNLLLYIIINRMSSIVNCSLYPMHIGSFSLFKIKRIIQ